MTMTASDDDDVGGDDDDDDDDDADDVKDGAENVDDDHLLETFRPHASVIQCTPQKCTNGQRSLPESLKREPTPPPWIESVSQLLTPPPWIESVKQLCTLAPSILMLPDLVHTRLYPLPLLCRWSYGMPFEDHSLVHKNGLRVHDDGHRRCAGICGNSECWMGMCAH